MSNQRRLRPISAAVEFEIKVDGEQVKGWVVRDGRSYRAHGDFRGERIDVRSTTQLRAEK